MIDVGFFELLLVGLAGLVIIGPKKLPVTFRTLGSLVAKARTYVSDVRSEIEKEMSLEELRATERTIKGNTKLGEGGNCQFLRSTRVKKSEFLHIVPSTVMGG